MKPIMMLLMLLGLSAADAGAQCRPPAGSNEARLLAFYEAPLVFSMTAAPTRVAAGELRLGLEAGNVPSPTPALQRPEFCYVPHAEHTKLTPAFGRPRLTFGLPAGLALEASYLPPITIGGATPNLASVALARPVEIALGRREATLSLRAHATFGRVQGAITCPHSALQTADAAAPCYGTQPSRDTFHPNMFGGEAALGVHDRDGRVALYAGGGVTWLRPRFRVGFTDATGYVDRTEVDADLVRGSAFGGLTVLATSAVAISGQAYWVPQDVATVRVGAEYRLHH